MSWRKIGQGVALVLLTLVVVLSLATTWLRVYIYEEDQYMATMEDLATLPELQEAVGIRIGSAVDERLDSMEWSRFVRLVTGNGSLQDSLLARDIDVGTFVQEQVEAVIQSDAFLTVWLEINRQAYPILSQALQGVNGEAVQTANGEVRINLYPIYALVTDRLRLDDIDLLQAVTIPEDALWLTVFEGEGLLKAQRAVKVVHDLSWVLPLAGLALAGVVIGTVTRRWRGAMAVGIAVAVGGLLLWGGLLIGVQIAANSMAEPVPADDWRAILREVTSTLRQWALLAAAIGAALAVGSWVLDRREREPVEAPAPETSGSVA